MDSDIPKSLRSFQAMLKLPDYPKASDASELPPPESFQRRLLMFLALPAVAACGGIVGLYGCRFGFAVAAEPQPFTMRVLVYEAMDMPFISLIVAAVGGAPFGVLTWLLRPARSPIPLAVNFLIALAAGAIPAVFFAVLFFFFL